MRNGVSPTDASHSPGEQAEMLADARASVCGFITNLIGNRLGDVAAALYPAMGQLEAEKHLLRNLRGDQKRKLGVHEIDTVLTVLGRDREERWLRFSLKRRGIRPPDEFDRPDEIENLRAEVDRLRKENEEKDAALRAQAEAFAKREGR